MNIEPLDKRNLEGIKLNNSKMIKVNKLGIDYFVFAMNIKEISQSLIENNIVVLNNGYSYIQILPIEKNYTLIMNYDEKSNLISWKFVVTFNNFLDERKLPFYEESELSIIVDSKLNIFEYGKEALEDSLNSKNISKEQYDFVIRQSEIIKVGIKENLDVLKKVSKKYYQIFFINKKEEKKDNRNAYRVNIKPGIKVAIVLKKDQKTGILTEGIVKDILTNSVVHHRGIKVRLTDGQVGRVQKILENLK